MGSVPRYLMCPPAHFQVDYVINAWMEGNVDRADRSLATEQWDRLRCILAGHGTVEVVTPLAGSPDMVFTANAGLVLGEQAVLSRFLHPEPKRRNFATGSSSTGSGYTNCQRICHSKAPATRFGGNGRTFLPGIVWNVRG
jgi:N-dimethylarginine dimethylaminohydrolase